MPCKLTLPPHSECFRLVARGQLALGCSLLVWCSASKVTINVLPPLFVPTLQAVSFEELNQLELRVNVPPASSLP